MSIEPSRTGTATRRFLGDPLNKQSSQERIPSEVRMFLSVVGEVLQEHLASVHHQHSRIDVKLDEAEDGYEGSGILSSKRRRTSR